MRSCRNPLLLGALALTCKSSPFTGENMKVVIPPALGSSTYLTGLRSESTDSFVVIPSCSGLFHLHQRSLYGSTHVGVASTAGKPGACAPVPPPALCTRVADLAL